MLAVLLFLCVVVVGLAAAVPAWRTAIQRQREAREIDYGREYRTAIRRYFHKNGRYPASLDALIQKDGNGIRYLRQPFADPLMPQAAAGASGADSGWDVIHFGQAVAAEIVDQPPQAAQGAGGGTSAGPSLPGLTQGSAPGGGSAAGGTSANPGNGPGSPGNGSAGGGPIIGVASLSKKPGVHAFNGFDIPNQWQFVYNYTQDPTLRAGGGSGAPTAPVVPGGGAKPTPSGPGH